MTNKLDKWYNCFLRIYGWSYRSLSVGSTSLYKSARRAFISRPVGPLSDTSCLYKSARRAFKLLVDTMCLLSCIHKELAT
jgi:hypothetical protein